MSVADSERRVRAAARILAEQWVSHPSEIDRVADSLMRDARTLERAGMLADPPEAAA